MGEVQSYVLFDGPRMYKSDLIASWQKIHSMIPGSVLGIVQYRAVFGQDCREYDLEKANHLELLSLGIARRFISWWNRCKVDSPVVIGDLGALITYFDLDSLPAHSDNGSDYVCVKFKPGIWNEDAVRMQSVVKQEGHWGHGRAVYKHRVGSYSCKPGNYRTTRVIQIETKCEKEEYNLFLESLSFLK